MAIIAGYFDEETYGLLGPQMAATIIRDHSPYECILIAVTRDYDRTALKNNLADYFGREAIGPTCPAYCMSAGTAASLGTSFQ